MKSKAASSGYWFKPVNIMTINEQNLDYKLDGGIGHRARIGLIALPDDQTIEHELRMIFDRPGVLSSGAECSIVYLNM